MIGTLFFLLGIHLATRLVAALYGIVDLGYDYAKYYPGVVGRILFWMMLIALIALPISPAHQWAFIAGIGVFMIFHIGIYWVGKLIIHRISQRSDEDLTE